jgi:uncharacterized protein (DUF1330 family)
LRLEVLDAESYETYKRMVPPSLAAYGGRFVVRGGAAETLEGSWSPEYAEAKTLRRETARTQMVIVEGV